MVKRKPGWTSSWPWASSWPQTRPDVVFPDFCTPEPKTVSREEFDEYRRDAALYFESISQQIDDLKAIILKSGEQTHDVEDRIAAVKKIAELLEVDLARVIE